MRTHMRAQLRTHDGIGYRIGHGIPYGSRAREGCAPAPARISMNLRVADGRWMSWGRPADMFIALP